MKLINQSVEYLPQEDLFKQIELAARTCYSEDTEVLTTNGWKYFKDVTNEDKVLTYIPETNKMIWDAPNIICNEIEDSMVEITHANIKLCITKDHRIYQSAPERREYNFLKASQIAGIEKIPVSRQCRFRIPKYFIGSKRDTSCIEIPTVKYEANINIGHGRTKIKRLEFKVSEDFMVIAGAYIAEGHTNNYLKWGTGSNCVITQEENTPLYNNVINALNNLKWNYRIHKDPRKPQIKWIVITGGILWVKMFDDLFGKGSKNKHLPKWFRKLPDEYLQIMLYNMYLGDGTHNKTRKERYLSISKRLLEEVQEVFILLGKNASLTYDSDINQKCSIEESTRDSWIINRKKHITILPPKKRKVYCTSTTSGIIQVRYKGKTCWCGNCYKSEDKITDDSAKKMVNGLIKAGHCYTGDCEVLTRNGWVKWKYYNNEDLAIVSTDLHFLGFESPTSVIRKKYKGKFYEFPAMGIKVTDGHRMFGVFRESKNDFYNSSSYNFFRCDQEYKDNNGRLKTLGERMFKSPRCCSTPVGFDAFHELIGFWLGDGCHSTHRNKLIFHLKKERKVNYLRHLCEELKFEFEEGANNYYRVVASNIGKSFNDTFYKDGYKYINNDIHRYSLENYSIILGLLNSDGSNGINTNTITYTTTSKYIKDWIEVTAPTVGFHISIHDILSQNTNQKNAYKILFQTTKYTINNDSRKPGTKCVITKEELDVYCATVSTGLLLVRGSNGVVSICGNCAMLEHGTVYLYYPVNCYSIEETAFISKYKNNPYTKIWNRVDDNPWEDGSLHTIMGKSPSGDVENCITTNYRVLVENGWLDDLKYQCEPTEHHIKRYTFRLTTSIGITRELIRHRVFSFANESTRYVSSCEKRSIFEYDCDCIEDIIAAYKQGFSMKEISNYSSLSESSIRTRLIDNGVIIRGLHNTGNRDENYFKSIDTPEKAYLLGLIQTDGNVRMTDRNAALTITQHKDYAWYVQCLLYCFSDKICKVNDKNCYQLQIGSKRIVEDLIDLGIVPNKTRVQTDEDVNTLWNSIPSEYKGDFIRGLIDGDGCVRYFTQKRGINESCNINLCSVKESLIDLIIQFIEDKFNYKCGKRQDNNVYILTITDYKKSIEIGKYLYTNFKYPFGHPKKASTWIKRILYSYPIADFKDPSFKVIAPTWISNALPDNIFNFIKSIIFAEDSYTKLRLTGLPPQAAREILPLCTKSELIMTGFEDDWKRFLDVRLEGTTGKPHPDMVELAKLIKDKLDRIKGNES